MDFSEKQNEILNNLKDKTKPNSVLYMLYQPGLARYLEKDLNAPDVDFVGFELRDLNVCMLPNDIHDDNELQRCLDESYIYDDTFWKVFQEFRSIDYSKYKSIVIWNNMTPYSILFLCMVCKFVDGCDIYENEVSKYDLGIYNWKEIKKDLSEIYSGLRKITPELKNHFANVYDSFAGKPIGPRISEGYDIVELCEEEVKDRILSHCPSNEYINAFKLTCQLESTYNLSNSYTPSKLYDYIIDEGLLDVKKTQDTTFLTALMGDSLMYEGVNLYFLGSYGVKLKKKWNKQ